jgi:hypothetical protein
MKAATRSPKPKGTASRAAGRRAAKSETSLPKDQSEIWLRIFSVDHPMTRETARAVLDLSIPQSDLALLRELSAKARAGTLTPEEDALMSEFERVGSILGVLKSKARVALKRAGQRG